jgi:hypothetical protein
MECKRLFWPWIVATVIAVPVLYVASFGPACWASSRCSEPNGFGVAAVEFVYQPLLRATTGDNELIRDNLRSYTMFGAAPNWYVRGACFSDDSYWQGPLASSAGKRR